MKIVQANSQLLASLQLIDEEGETLFSHFVLGRSEVEQVGAVRNDEVISN